MKVPMFLMWFYAFNQLSFASGMMDAMNGMMFGTSAELLPCYTGPVGDFGNFASFVSSVALGFMFMIDETTPKEAVKKIFMVRRCVASAWRLSADPACHLACAFDWPVAHERNPALQAFGAIGVTWGLGIIPWCYMNGIMGVPAVAMFGPVVAFHIAVSALVLSKL
jgi:hypothetical protein